MANELLGTGGAISNILKILPKSFFVLYGDTYLPIDFKALVDFHKNKINSENSLLTIYKNNSKLDLNNIIYENNVIIKNIKNKLEQKNETYRLWFKYNDSGSIYNI